MSLVHQIFMLFFFCFFVVVVFCFVLFVFLVDFNVVACDFYCAINISRLLILQCLQKSGFGGPLLLAFRSLGVYIVVFRPTLNICTDVSSSCERYVSVARTVLHFRLRLLYFTLPYAGWTSTKFRMFII